MASDPKDKTRRMPKSCWCIVNRDGKPVKTFPTKGDAVKELLWRAAGLRRRAAKPGTTYTVLRYVPARAKAKTKASVKP